MKKMKISRPVSLDFDTALKALEVRLDNIMTGSAVKHHKAEEAMKDIQNFSRVYSNHPNFKDTISEKFGVGSPLGEWMIRKDSRAKNEYLKFLRDEVQDPKLQFDNMNTHSKLQAVFDGFDKKIDPTIELERMQDVYDTMMNTVRYTLHTSQKELEKTVEDVHTTCRDIFGLESEIGKWLQDDGKISEQHNQFLTKLTTNANISVLSNKNSLINTAKTITSVINFHAFKDRIQRFMESKSTQSSASTAVEESHSNKPHS